VEDRSRHDRPLNVALLGYGFASKTFHAPLLVRVPGLRLRHIVSSDSAKVHRDYEDISVLAQPEEAFADPDVDLIVIATPNLTHFDLAHRALGAGKHVVVDKPFTNTVADGTALVKLARAQKKVLSVFQSRRWDGDFLTLRKLLAGGALGEVALFECHYDRYRPQPRQRWREQAGPGSGIWFDLGPHLIDQVLQLFGAPESICADLEIQRTGGQAIDYFHIVFRYGRNRAILHGASLVVAESPRFVVHGTMGSFTKFGMDTQEESLKRGEIPGSAGWGVDPKMGMLITKKDDGFETREVPNVPGNYLGYYEGLRDAITSGAPNPVTAEDGLEVINVIETAENSAATRAEVPFIPIKL
jgi:scyllo-inositol 2-dehydrogenase (NADP+)